MCSREMCGLSFPSPWIKAAEHAYHSKRVVDHRLSQEFFIIGTIDLKENLLHWWIRIQTNHLITNRPMQPIESDFPA